MLHLTTSINWHKHLCQINWCFSYITITPLRNAISVRSKQINLHVLSISYKHELIHSLTEGDELFEELNDDLLEHLRSAGEAVMVPLRDFSTSMMLTLFLLPYPVGKSLSSVRECAGLVNEVLVLMSSALGSLKSECVVDWHKLCLVLVLA